MLLRLCGRTVATTANEAKNPKRNIPLAIVMSLTISFLVYFGISTVLTMMWPYYDQDAKAPFPYVFDKVDWITIKWIVTVGAIFALLTSLTSLTSLATIVSGVLAGFMAILFDVDQLIEMMSIGTLLAYTIVAVCVLVLRYRQDDKGHYPELEYTESSGGLVEVTMDRLRLLFNLNNNKVPTAATSVISNLFLLIYSIVSIGVGAFALFATDYIHPDEPLALTGFIILCLVLLMVFAVIARQPVQDPDIAFKCPWVPLMPCLSITVNIALMLKLGYETWIRFAAWLLVGFLIYFLYGIRHSLERGAKDIDMVVNSEPRRESQKSKLG